MRSSAYGKILAAPSNADGSRDVSGLTSGELDALTESAEWFEQRAQADLDAARELASRVVALAEPAPKTSKRATNDVIRNLRKSEEHDPTYADVGLSFDLADVASFRTQARRWLVDRSNLKTATIDSADWTEVYETFRDLASG
ncbi:hypothetical protein ACWEVP_31820 [Amycolatopsis sp. NPDC003865]